MPVLISTYKELTNIYNNALLFLFNKNTRSIKTSQNIIFSLLDDLEGILEPVS